MTTKFESENADFISAVAGKSDHVDYELIRYADGSVDVLTGADIPPQPVPEVDDIQIRAALNEMGLRAAVEQYVANAAQDVKDWWDRAQWFQIDNEMVQAAAAALGVTREQLVALFRLAATKAG